MKRKQAQRTVQYRKGAISFCGNNEECKRYRGRPWTKVLVYIRGTHLTVNFIITYNIKMRIYISVGNEIIKPSE